MAVGHVPRNRRFHLSTHHDNGLLHRKHGPAGAGLAPFYGFTGINEAGISASETAVTTLDEKELRPAHTTVNFALNIDVPMLGLPFYWRNNTFSPEQYWLHFHIGREHFRFPVTRETYERVGTGDRLMVDYRHRRLTGGDIPCTSGQRPERPSPVPRSAKAWSASIQCRTGPVFFFYEQSPYLPPAMAAFS